MPRSFRFDPFIFVRRRWLVATLLVLGGIMLMVRLGIWQLDRLAARRAFNGRVSTQINSPTLILDAKTIHQDLIALEYRKVQVQGSFDFSHQVAIRNQAYQDQWGVDLVTPLKINGTNLWIMVDRGWIPGEEYLSGNWSRYDQPGTVTVDGIIRRPQTRPEFGQRSDPVPVPGNARITAWNFVNLESMAIQMPYKLRPVYIQQTQVGTDPSLPKPHPAELDLSEGPHQSYAIQWFTFAVMLALGYPFFIYRKEKGKQEHA